MSQLPKIILDAMTKFEMPVRYQNKHPRGRHRQLKHRKYYQHFCKQDYSLEAMAKLYQENRRYPCVR